jgi:protein-disulfide isomerase
MTTVARRDRRQGQLDQRRDARRSRQGQGRSKQQRSLMLPLTVGAIVIGIIVIAAIAFLRQDGPMTEGINEPGPGTRSAYQFADGRALGPADAAVTVGVWSDYQCPFCQRFATGWETTLSTQFVESGQVRIAYMDFAFLGEESIAAAAAARCAEDDGKYWQYHDYLFANQNPAGENKGWITSGRLQGYAQAVGLDLGAFNACRASPDIRAAVLSETAQGRAAGVTGTPTLSINGTLRTDIKSYDDLAAAVQAALVPQP